MEESSEIVRVKNLCEFLEHVMELRHGKSQEEGVSQTWFFRGQKNAMWPIRPNIFRENNLSHEHVLIDQARRRNPQAFKDCTSRIEILTKLQHYGLGTRLLDVTLNPLVALYFATAPDLPPVPNGFEDTPGEPVIEESEDDNGGSIAPGDGAVYIAYSYYHSEHALCARIAASLAFEDISRPLPINGFLRRMCDAGAINSEEREYLSANQYKNLISFLQTSQFIMPSHSNERLIRQSGAFLLSTAVNIIRALHDDHYLMHKAVGREEDSFHWPVCIIPANYKELIREELDVCNMNESALFPELEHQMAYIHSKTSITVIPADNFTPYREAEFSEQISEDFEKDDPTAALNDAAVNNILTVIIKRRIAHASSVLIRRLCQAMEPFTKILDWYEKESVLMQMVLESTRILKTNGIDSEAKKIARSIISEYVQRSLHLAREC